MLANVYKVNLPVPFSNLSSSKLVNNEYACIEFSVLLLIGISTFPLFIISLQFIIILEFSLKVEVMYHLVIFPLYNQLGNFC